MNPPYAVLWMLLANNQVNDLSTQSIRYVLYICQFSSCLYMHCVHMSTKCSFFGIKILRVWSLNVQLYDSSDTSLVYWCILFCWLAFTCKMCDSFQTRTLELCLGVTLILRHRTEALSTTNKQVAPFRYISELQL